MDIFNLNEKVEGLVSYLQETTIAKSKNSRPKNKMCH